MKLHSQVEGEAVYLMAEGDMIHGTTESQKASSFFISPENDKAFYIIYYGEGDKASVQRKGDARLVIIDRPYLLSTNETVKLTERATRNDCLFKLCPRYDIDSEKFPVNIQEWLQGEKFFIELPWRAFKRTHYISIKKDNSESQEKFLSVSTTELELTFCASIFETSVSTLQPLGGLLGSSLVTSKRIRQPVLLGSRALGASTGHSAELATHVKKSKVDPQLPSIHSGISFQPSTPWQPVLLGSSALGASGGSSALGASGLRPSILGSSSLGASGLRPSILGSSALGGSGLRPSILGLSALGASAGCSAELATHVENSKGDPQLPSIHSGITFQPSTPVFSDIVSNDYVLPEEISAADF